MPVGMSKASRVSRLPDAIPDSVLYQYPQSTFTTSTWTDDVGTADMAVNGMVAGTFSNGEDSVFGDGTDDNGTANGPEDLPQNQTFGVAFTFEAGAISTFVEFFGVFNSPTGFQIRSGVQTSGGDINLRVDDNSDNSLGVYTTNTYDDGTPHAVIINKSGNSAADIDVYVDDMVNPASITTKIDQPFDHTNYSITTDMGFFARNNAGTIDGHIEMDAGIFEFNSGPYSQTEREDFVSRRPEV